MTRYFMSYNDYINNGKILDKNVDIHSDDMKLFKKCGNGEYIVEPLIYFFEYSENYFEYIEHLQRKRPNISFMIELTQDEAISIPKFLVKTFDNVSLNRLKEIKQDKEIELLEYDVMDEISFDDIEKGRKVLVHKINNDSYQLNIFDDFNFKINAYAIAEGVYFYTEDKRVLDRFRYKTTTFEKDKNDQYKLNHHRLIIIDSIGEDRISDHDSNTYKYLYSIYNTSKVVYIINDGNQYGLLTIKSPLAKKGFILNESIDNIISNPLLEPLYKYINIYELKNGKYEKISLEDYKNKHILKYIKKPN